jgi:hypothetical protein
MIRYASLWIVVGSNFSAAITRADEGLTHSGALFLSAIHFGLKNARSQNCHGLFGILVLRSTFLTFDNNARWSVRQSNSGFSLVYVLTSRPTGSKSISLNISWIDYNVKLLCLR